MSVEAQPWPDQDGKKYCNARLVRHGVLKYCKKFAEEGRARCKWHGGKTLRGVEHPNFKHGLCTDPENLGELGLTISEVAKKYAEGGDKQYIDLKTEILVVDSLLQHSLGKLKDPKAVPDQKSLLELVNNLRLLKESFNKIQNGVKYTLSIETVQVCILKISAIIKKHITDGEVAKLIEKELLEITI